MIWFEVGHPNRVSDRHKTLAKKTTGNKLIRRRKLHERFAKALIDHLVAVIAVCGCAEVGVWELQTKKLGFPNVPKRPEKFAACSRRRALSFFRHRR